MTDSASAALRRQLGFGPWGSQGSRDPLDEQASSPVPGLVRRYRDRALVLATKSCFVQCAFCTRQQFVRADGDSGLTVDIEAAVGYLSGAPEIREVLVSGGDPLTLSDEALDRVLGSVRRVRHVKILRVATRAPMARPDRVTDGLVRLLGSHGPLYVSVHFNHPEELTDEARRACAALVDGGLPLLNQTVLLRGVNDDPDVLTQLCLALATLRVRPYYLLSCDRVAGTEPFWVDLDRALDIAHELGSRLPGHAVPAFVVDLPGWEGKARPTRDHGARKVEGGHMVTAPSGREVFYPGPTR